MQWKYPPVIKIYEALGAVADGRVHMAGAGAKVYSSSGNKFYEVDYDAAAQAIMVNDNGSYYQGYLGYPAIAYLMVAGSLSYSTAAAELLKGIAWKDINTKFKNDFDKTLEFILADKTSAEREVIEEAVHNIDTQVQELNLSMLGERTKPPQGY